MVRPAPAALALLAILASACAQPAQFVREAAACLKPSDGNAQSLPALVDRADIVVLATVTKTESLTPSIPPGQPRDLIFRTLDDDGQRVTLKVTETVKGTVPAELVVYDAPCQLLAARTGESLVVLLETPPLADGTYRPIGLPVSALRATPDRSLAQLVSEIRQVRPLDGDAKALFERFGWSVVGKSFVDEFPLPPASEFGLAGREIRALGARLVDPFERYATLSAAAGLDPRPYAAKPAELLTFFLEQKRGEALAGTILGHALVVERRLVGAWVSLSREGGSFSLADRAAVLATPVATPGTWSPPANRVPQGINIARAYDLANARSIAFKTGAGKAADITDPAKIRSFAAALDETLATTQAVNDREQPPTRFWFYVDFRTRYLSLQYDSADGTLTVLLDGFTAKAPARFVALVANLP